MARTDTLGNFLTDVADAIRTKAGTSEPIQASAFDTAIANIPSGGGDVVEEKDVNFFDYDGTLVYSYTKTDFANLEAMPENPTHSGLTAQGWNWTLSDAKTFVNTYGMLDIAQNYVTSTGETRIYIKLIDKSRLSPYMRFVLNGTLTIDWGDGSAVETYTNTSLLNDNFVQHTYSAIGEYIIKTKLTDGTSYSFPAGNAAYGTNILTPSNASVPDQNDHYFRDTIYKIELGTGLEKSRYQAYAGMFSMLHNLETITIPNYVTFYNAGYVFYNCWNLKFVSLPTTVTGLGNYFFNTCRSMKRISMPKEITVISNYCFSGTGLERLILTGVTTPLGDTSCGGMQRLTNIIVIDGMTSITRCFINNPLLKTMRLPNTLTSFLNQIFYNDTCLQYIKIPKSVTELGANNFYQCYNLAYVDFSDHEAVPTLGNANSFNSAYYCKIIVPDNLYSSWTTANVWSSISSMIIKKSDWDAL